MSFLAAFPAFFWTALTADVALSCCSHHESIKGDFIPNTVSRVKHKAGGNGDGP